MSKANKDVPELTDQELAFEMIEITCDEMDSLTRAFKMITTVCRELNFLRRRTSIKNRTDTDIKKGGANASLFFMLARLEQPPRPSSDFL